jgi:hypothetical protein
VSRNQRGAPVASAHGEGPETTTLSGVGVPRNTTLEVLIATKHRWDGVALRGRRALILLERVQALEEGLRRAADLSWVLLWYPRASAWRCGC